MHSSDEQFMKTEDRTLEQIRLDSIEDAIRDIKAGKVVIVVDDEDRENEGDFICAAECVNPEIINFMATHGRGLICAPIEEERAEALRLNMMVNDNTSLHETAFTVSVDLIGHGCTTGISAHDRAKTIEALVRGDTTPSDFARPGHVFPLKAKKGGVLRRTGHTEAAIDLARLAGYYPAGVLVEILNADGSMARLPQLVGIAEQHDLKIISIRDLIAFRMRTERIIEQKMETAVSSEFGDFKVTVFEQRTTGDLHLAVSCGVLNADEATLVRVHSNTETGDVLGMLFDDYAGQIRETLRMISNAGKGVLLFMRHQEKEGNLVDELQRFSAAAQDPAKHKSRSQRDFGVGAQILREMGVRKIRLITNRPRKRIGLMGYGLEIVEHVEATPK